MAIEFGKGIALAGGFDLGAKAPLDSRLAVATIADRDAHVTGNRAYEGMLVYVEENKVTYQYIADAEGNLSWKEFGFNLADFQGQVINNLESDDTTKALSAAQGKALKALIDAEAETARGAEEANADAIAALDEKVGAIPTDEEGNAVATTVVAYVDQKVAAEAELARAAEKANADAIKAITDDYLVEADKTELQGNIDTLAGKVTTLIGDDADKSVRAIANEELAKQLIADGAKEALDSLEEIAAWIQAHPDDAAAMHKAIEDLEALVGTLPEDVTATTIVDLIQELVKAEEDRAKLAEQGLDGRLQTIEAKFEGEESVENKIADAKQEAIDTAKEYADDLDEAMDLRVDALEADTHTHANKDELDLIVAGDKAKWDAAEAKAHEHANKALLDTYTQTEENLADAVAKKHAHENADVLAGITAEKVTAWDAAEQNAKDYVDTELNELVNGTIATHTTEINSLDERVDDLEAASATHALASDLTALDGRVTTAEGKIADLEAKFTGENSVDSKIEAALTEAKGYTDAEIKELAEGAVAGNTAAIEAINNETTGILAQAKKHADDLDAAMNTRVEALEAIDHDHANKAELDKFVDGDKAKLDDAATKAHVHANAEVIDGITAEKVAAWDAAEQNAKDYADAEDAKIEEELAKKAAQTDLEAEAKTREDADKAINDKIGEVAEGKTLVEMIEEAQEAATYDDTEVKADIAENAEAIDAINNADTGILKQAKDYADGLNTTMSGRMDTAESDIDAIQESLAEGGATATAIANAQSAADKAQEEVDALEEALAAIVEIPEADILALFQAEA